MSIFSGILFRFRIPERCILIVKGVKSHIEDFNSVDAVMVICSSARKESLGTRLEEPCNPNMGYYKYGKRKFLAQKLRFFSYSRGSLILPPSQPRLLVRLPRCQQKQFDRSIALCYMFAVDVHATFYPLTIPLYT